MPPTLALQSLIYVLFKTLSQSKTNTDAVVEEGENDEGDYGEEDGDDENGDIEEFVSTQR
jgi:hypothetical protein